MKKLPVCMSIMVVFITIMACSAKPADFVTFADELNLFTISYPSNWELANSLMGEFETIVKDVIESKKSGLKLEVTGFVFMGGMPTQEGYVPNMSIVVESLPARLSLAEYSEVSQKNAQEMFAGYKLHTQASVLLGNKEAVMSDWEYDLSSFLDANAVGKSRAIQALTVDGEVGWVVTCAGLTPMSSEDLRTCDAVVRSFRILQ